MNIPKTALVVSLMIAAVFTSVMVTAANNKVAEAETLVHSLAAGKYTSVEATFNTQMQQGLPTSKLKEAWKQITAQAGSYIKTGETKTVDYHGDTVVLVKTLFKNGALWTQVAFDKNGKVAGLYFRPAS